MEYQALETGTRLLKAGPTVGWLEMNGLGRDTMGARRDSMGRDRIA
jgi:hypothetical protein